MTCFFCVLLLAAVAFTASGDELFPGIKKRPYQVQSSLVGLIPDELKSSSISLSKVKRHRSDNTIVNCIAYADDVANEMLGQVARNVQTTFGTTMRQYTQLAYALIMAGKRAKKNLQAFDWIKFLSLIKFKGHCLLEFVYRTGVQYDDTVFNVYLFFSDLENISVTSIGKTLTNEKLLKLIELKTKIPMPVDGNEDFDRLRSQIDATRQTINQQSGEFCAVTDSWFHPNNIKFKNIMYNLKTPHRALKKFIEDNEHKQVSTKMTGYDFIRSENDVKVLFKFSNVVVEGIVQELAELSVPSLNVMHRALSDWALGITKDFYVENNRKNQNSPAILIDMVHVYENSLQQIEKMIFKKHGMKVGTNNDLLYSIKSNFSHIRVKLENILHKKIKPTTVEDIAKEIQKFKETLADKINYTRSMTFLEEQINWENYSVGLQPYISLMHSVATLLV